MKAVRFQEWISYAKAIAILLVVYRHILIGIERSGLEINQFLMDVNETFYSFRMPLFFLIAGIFINKSIAKRTNYEFVKTKLDSLIYPYILWCVFQITLQIILKDYTNANRGLIDYAYIIIQPRAIDHLWFLMALFNTSILYFLLKKVSSNGWVLLAVAITTHFTSIIFKDFSVLRDPLYYLIFLVLGTLVSPLLLDKVFREKSISLKYFLIIIPLFIISQFYWLTHKTEIHPVIFILVEIIGSIFMIQLSILMDKYNVLPWLKKVGRHSLYIYLAHVTISSALRIGFVNILGITNVYILLPLGIVASTFLSILLYNLSIKYHFQFLFHPVFTRIKPKP